MHFRLSLLELGGMVTFAAIACYAVANSSDVIAHIAQCVELFAVLGAIAVIPSSAGDRARFLIAFACSAAVYNQFAFHAPLDAILRWTWGLSAASTLPTSERDYFNYATTAESVVGLSLAIIVGLIARSLKPKEGENGV